MTSTGPSAMTSSSASVITMATSSTRSESGFRPDISMSTQTRLFSLYRSPRGADSRGGCDIISALIDRGTAIEYGARLSHGRLRASPFLAMPDTERGLTDHRHVPDAVVVFCCVPAADGRAEVLAVVATGSACGGPC